MGGRGWRSVAGRLGTRAGDRGPAWVSTEKEEKKGMRRKSRRALVSP